jgi:hypothetical protein
MMLMRTIQTTLTMLASLAAIVCLTAIAAAPTATAAATTATATAAMASPAKPPPGLITWCEPGGSIPCLAQLQHPPVIYYGHSGGSQQLPSDDLVEISCYYFGSPVLHGDNVEDHVVALATPSGPTPLNGHVPDWNVNLGGHNPWQEGIPAC